MVAFNSYRPVHYAYTHDSFTIFVEWRNCEYCKYTTDSLNVEQPLVLQYADIAVHYETRISSMVVPAGSWRKLDRLLSGAQSDSR